MSLHDLVKVTGNVEAIKEKIVMGANVDEIDKLHRAPIHMAAWSGNLEALQLLVRANANLNLKAMDGFTPLHFAAQSSSADAPACIRLLVKKNKALLHQRITKGNKSALHLAASKGSVPNVTALLELRADVSAKTTAGQTAADLAKTPEVKALLAAYTNSTQKAGGGEKSAPDECSDGSEGSEDDGSGDEGGVEAVEAVEAAQIAVVSAQEIEVDSTQENNNHSRKRPISEVVTDER